jgi:hypothetical protein
MMDQKSSFPLIDYFSSTIHPEPQHQTLQRPHGGGRHGDERERRLPLDAPFLLLCIDLQLASMGNPL